MTFQLKWQMCLYKSHRQQLLLGNIIEMVCEVVMSYDSNPLCYGISNCLNCERYKGFAHNEHLNIILYLVIQRSIQTISNNKHQREISPNCVCKTTIECCHNMEWMNTWKSLGTMITMVVAVQHNDIILLKHRTLTTKLMTQSWEYYGYRNVPKFEGVQWCFT